MIDDLFDVISERAVALAVLGSVNPALSDRARVLPAADVWLAEDRMVADQPAEIRELVFVLRLEVAHQAAAGALQRQMHRLIDALRAGFVGWRPDDCRGIQGRFSLPLVKIQSYQDHGPAVYLVSLAVRVFPAAFARTS